jgi:primosomal replication protein N
MKAVAVGDIAQALNQLPIGEAHGFTGFLGSPRNGRGVLLHITALHDIV